MYGADNFCPSVVICPPQSASEMTPTFSPKAQTALMAQEFSDVSIVVPANIYFDGAVTSRTVRFADGTEKTLGLMQPGEYEFGTEKAELMEITAGEVQVQFDGETKWSEYTAGDSFNVPSDSRFKIIASEVTDYVCSYLEA